MPLAERVGHFAAALFNEREIWQDRAMTTITLEKPNWISLSS